MNTGRYLIPSRRLLIGLFLTGGLAACGYKDDLEPQPPAQPAYDAPADQGHGD